MSQLALFLFGPPRLELDGAQVHIPRRKALALLAYLAVTSQPHSRDSLAALLWPENDQSSARGGLRRMLSEIKGALGEGWLTTDRETARLNKQNDLQRGSSFKLDVDDFRGKLKVCEAHNHPPTVTCPECLPKLEEAIDLYHDDFMVGFSLKDCPAYDEWQFFQAEEMRGQLVNALVRLSTHYAYSLEYEIAIRHARRWLVLNPLQEAAHRQLMSLFLQSGQRAAALRQYQVCRETLVEELGVQPSEETRELYQKVQVSTVAASKELRPKSNLPVQTTIFIGRINKLAEIRAKLKDNGCHLLTLLGPGGSGKTRLAIEAADGLLNDFKHGAFFVNLAHLQEAEKIPTTIATALKFKFSGEGTPDEQLLDYLRSKQMLLILDNFEHLLEGVVFVNQIMRAAPKVNILATSRIRLMVTGEHLYDVWGMAYPESSASLEIASQQYSAIKLFESEARRVYGDFKLSEENLEDVIEICSLLEGMPLGIVLAASWVTVLKPAEIATEITRDLAFLDEEMADLPRRQRGMRSTFNYSWRLLSEGQREIMPALSVFQGGITRDAAQAVAGASLRDLKKLTDQSMLHRSSNGRYEMHELVRQYAAEKLASNPTVETDIREKHSHFYCQALAIWDRELQGPRQAAANQEMKIEIGNIRSAWRWAVESLRIRLLSNGLWGYGHFCGRNEQHQEGEAAFQFLVERLDFVAVPDGSKAVLQADGSKDQIDRILLKAMALSFQSGFNSILGNPALGSKLAQQSLSLIKELELMDQDIRREKAITLFFLSMGIYGQSRDESIQKALESLACFRSLGDKFREAMMLSYLGDRTFPNIAESRQYEHESLLICRKLGDLNGIASSLESLSRLAARQGQFEKAEEMIYESTAIFTELDDRFFVVHNYGTLGLILVRQGKFKQARSLMCEILDAHHDLVHSQSYAAIILARTALPDQYLGGYESARIQAQHAIAFFKESKNQFMIQYGTAVANAVLGRVALGEGNYTVADRWFNECIPVFRNMGGDLSRTLACKGYVARGLKQISQAQDCFLEALCAAMKHEDFLPLIHALPGIALLFADQGEVEQAVELYALASTYGIVANSKWFDDIAGDEIAAMAEELPFEVAEAAKVRGRGLDLWLTAAELLVELDVQGWGGAEQERDSTTPELEETEMELD